jgi:uncharacterized OB-fold protein
VDRPLPEPDADSAPFWEACGRHELRVQRCGECGARRHPPRPLCPHCQSSQVEWERLSGRGEVYSWVVAHPPVLPAFQDRVPFAVVLVALAEDSRLRFVGNLLGCEPGDVRIGLPVEVAFEELAADVTLPQWRPVERVG